MARAVPAELAAPAVVLITGAQAAGKSTVAQLLAEQLPKSVHVRGDRFRRMIVNGRVDMTPAPSEEATRQLELRYRLTAQVCDEYAAAGFTAIAQDVVLGHHLTDMTTTIRSRPLFLVVLAPRPEALAERESARRKTASGTWTAHAMDDVLRRGTPHLGLWLDTSRQAPEDTVEAILSRAGREAAI